jgi:hypothetical protein
VAYLWASGKVRLDDRYAKYGGVDAWVGSRLHGSSKARVRRRSSAQAIRSLSHAQ